MAANIAHYQGRVARANDRGIRLEGSEHYLNVSKFRPVDVPPVGAYVDVAVADGNWLHAVTVLDGQEAHSTPQRAVAAPGVRERTITRLAVLKAAAAFAASRPDAKSPDVLTVADVWLRWVEGEV
jgi:hypothetical protein